MGSCHTINSKAGDVDSLLAPVVLTEGMLPLRTASYAVDDSASYPVSVKMSQTH